MTGAAGGLPFLGFGTSPRPRTRPLDLEPALAAALDCGYRLFDTAEAYGTEPILGRLLAASGRARDEVLLIGKVWQTNHAPERLLEACERSLERLGVDHLDLYLVHAPESWRYLGPLEVRPGWTYEEIAARLVPRDASGAVEPGGVALPEAWEAMLEARRRGWVREVGVANLDRPGLESLLATGLPPPAALQLELHPLCPRRHLVARCRELGIRVLAHSPLGGGRVLGEPRLAPLAAAAGCTPAQLVLAWHAARGATPIAGSLHPAHVRENLEAARLTPPAETVRALDGLACSAPDASGSLPGG